MLHWGFNFECRRESGIINMTTTFTAKPFKAKSILIVDDYPEVADSIHELLKVAGYRVQKCSSPIQALEEFEPGKYDLVITDYSMPRMNGVTLAREMKQRAPNQLIMLISAFVFSLAAREEQPIPADFILQKPFTAQELTKALECLFQPQPPLAGRV